MVCIASLKYMQRKTFPLINTSVATNANCKYILYADLRHELWIVSGVGAPSICLGFILGNNPPLRLRPRLGRNEQLLKMGNFFGISFDKDKPEDRRAIDWARWYLVVGLGLMKELAVAIFSPFSFSEWWYCCSTESNWNEEESSVVGSVLVSFPCWEVRSITWFFSSAQV